MKRIETTQRDRDKRNVLSWCAVWRWSESLSLRSATAGHSSCVDRRRSERRVAGVTSRRHSGGSQPRRFDWAISRRQRKRRTESSKSLPGVLALSRPRTNRVMSWWFVATHVVWHVGYWRFDMTIRQFQDRSVRQSYALVRLYQLNRIPIIIQHQTMSQNCCAGNMVDWHSLREKRLNGSAQQTSADLSRRTTMRPSGTSRRRAEEQMFSEENSLY